MKCVLELISSKNISVKVVLVKLKEEESNITRRI